MRTLSWTWTQYNSNIKIYDGEKLIGRIPHFYDNAAATINKKMFFIDTPKRMYRTFISDPKDKKAYCEIDHISPTRLRIFCPAFDYSGEKGLFWPFKRKNYISNKGIRMVELEIPGGFFKNKGTITIFQEENYELVIYCLFYLNTLSSD